MTHPAARTKKISSLKYVLTAPEGVGSPSGLAKVVATHDDDAAQMLHASCTVTTWGGIESYPVAK